MVSILFLTDTFAYLLSPKKSWLLIPLIFVMVFCTDQLASTVIRSIEIRLRPSHIPGIENLLHYVNNYRGGQIGFISAHACNVSGLTIYLTMITRKRFKWLPYLLFAWAILVYSAHSHLCKGGNKRSGYRFGYRYKNSCHLNSCMGGLLFPEVVHRDHDPPFDKTEREYCGFCTFKLSINAEKGEQV